MRDHIRILAYLHIVLGALGLLAALTVLVIAGGVAGIVGVTNPQDAPWMFTVPVIGVVGVAIFTIVLLLSIPGMILGFGLLKFRPWARVLGIVLSAMDLVHVPFGTALGVYGLWVLLKPETEQLLSSAG